MEHVEQAYKVVQGTYNAILFNSAFEPLSSVTLHVCSGCWLESLTRSLEPRGPSIGSRQ